MSHGSAGGVRDEHEHSGALHLSALSSLLTVGFALLRSVSGRLQGPDFMCRLCALCPDLPSVVMFLKKLFH